LKGVRDTGGQREETLKLTEFRMGLDVYAWDWLRGKLDWIWGFSNSQAKPYFS
jgi:hypothetical protein